MSRSYWTGSRATRRKSGQKKQLRLLWRSWKRTRVPSTNWTTLSVAETAVRHSASRFQEALMVVCKCRIEKACPTSSTVEFGAGPTSSPITSLNPSRFAGTPSSRATPSRRTSASTRITTSELSHPFYRQCWCHATPTRCPGAPVSCLSNDCPILRCRRTSTTTRTQALIRPLSCSPCLRALASRDPCPLACLLEVFLLQGLQCHQG